MGKLMLDCLYPYDIYELILHLYGVIYLSHSIALSKLVGEDICFPTHGTVEGPKA